VCSAAVRARSYSNPFLATVDSQQQQQGVDCLLVLGTCWLPPYEPLCGR
jgi:hypothetical protein